MNFNDLNAEIARCGYSIPEFATAIGLSKKTMYSRMRGETEFSQGEIKKVAEVLHLSDEQVIAIFFASQVA